MKTVERIRELLAGARNWRSTREIVECDWIREYLQRAINGNFEGLLLPRQFARQKLGMDDPCQLEKFDRLVDEEMAAAHLRRQIDGARSFQEAFEDAFDEELESAVNDASVHFRRFHRRLIIEDESSGISSDDLLEEAGEMVLPIRQRAK